MTPVQLGRYAKDIARAEFVRFGFEVQSPEAGDHDVDFVVRKSDSRTYGVKVKSARNLNYIFFRKDRFPLRDDLMAVVVLFSDGAAPDLYLIPSQTWLTPSALFKSYDYKGMSSSPEWGLNLSQGRLPLLSTFAFPKMIGSLQ